MNQYFTKLNQSSVNRLIVDIKKYAIENKVPIVSESGLFYLLFLIRLIKAKNILEIGTAIAYSAIQFAIIDSNIHVDTIEKNEQMVQLANHNVQKMKLEKQIRVFYADALELDEKDLIKQYDLIFIDAAKAQYIKFFEKYEPYLRKDGLIVSDNLLFHGLITTTEPIHSKNLRSLITKIKKYNEWLSNHKRFDTIFLEIGDGMAVSRKL